MDDLSGSLTRDGFNPRPREGATMIEAEHNAQEAVSIHAPVKGRPRPGLDNPEINSFNPRPREGATVARYFGSKKILFQSTPP